MRISVRNKWNKNFYFDPRSLPSARVFADVDLWCFLIARIDRYA
jgi:hypothetical protein